MPSQCPVCSKINPAEATYCYHDGTLLSRQRQQGPLHVGTMPFPTAFHFSDGQACGNFNQLALACDSRWEEARSLLAEGIWPAFFGGMGRLDLAVAARQAAGEPDSDRGLSQLLEKLPADPDCLRPPKLAVESTEENLGQLTPGADLSFELVIFNQGMLLLRGTVSSSCDWLVFGDRAGPAQKVFQTRGVYTIAVRVLGSKLHAGLKPLEGEIVIDTNGGVITVPVRAEIPIKSFPRGASANDALAGARSPREIAVKAREHPKEAAILFAEGAVKTWYESNGWTYPVEGSAGTGKGAVQQFFEALGLTKPPQLEINITSLRFKGEVGERRSTQVMLRAKEAKPVYAQAWSNKDWVKCGPIKYLGNKVEIPIEIVIPSYPGETVRAQVTIQGNGKQQFVVPVSVAVGMEHVPVVIPLDPGLFGDSSPANWWLWAAWFAGGFVVTTFIILFIAALVLRRFL